MDMHNYFVIPPILGLAGLAVAFIIYHIMSRHNHGDGKVRKIGDQIHLGAMVFMAREYKMLSLFALVLLVAIFVSPLGLNTAIAFIVGAVSSATAGQVINPVCRAVAVISDGRVIALGGAAGA